MKVDQQACSEQCAIEVNGNDCEDRWVGDEDEEGTSSQEQDQRVARLQGILEESQKKGCPPIEVFHRAAANAQMFGDGVGATQFGPGHEQAAQGLCHRRVPHAGSDRG